MIDQATEEKLVVDSGHEMGCWEWWVEVVVEASPQKEDGYYELEGRHDEIHPRTQMTLMDMFYAETTRETWQVSKCHCETLNQPED